MKNFIERDGKIFWNRPADKLFGGPGKLIPEENIARFLMLLLRRCGHQGRTCRGLRIEVRNTFGINFTDKDMRGILRRMQIQGKPVVSTFHGFALASKEKIKQQALRMLRHGWAEVNYSRQLLGSRLWDREVGQLKLKVKL